jgi:hypothetical protein
MMPTQFVPISIGTAELESGENPVAITDNSNRLAHSARG